MAHTYTKLLVHMVFATRRRQKCLDATLRPELWAYIGGIARQHKVIALAISGVEDHVHLLLSLPPSLSVSEVAKAVKGASSRWINETYPNTEFHTWQEGYGAFTIGVSQVDRTVAYIQNQERHHQQETYHEELRRFVMRHNLAYYADEEE
jgi:REP element-mobilizing transposase RayT